MHFSVIFWSNLNFTPILKFGIITHLFYNSLNFAPYNIWLNFAYVVVLMCCIIFHLINYLSVYILSEFKIKGIKFKFNQNRGGKTAFKPKKYLYLLDKSHVFTELFLIFISLKNVYITFDLPFYFNS
jgi:hypothetical protein